MAKVEIDETDLRNYQQVFTAVRAGLANPKTRAVQHHHDRLVARYADRTDQRTDLVEAQDRR